MEEEVIQVTIVDCCEADHLPLVSTPQYTLSSEKKYCIFMDIILYFIAGLLVIGLFRLLEGTIIHSK